jgi:hypothetical protein
MSIGGKVSKGIALLRSRGHQIRPRTEFRQILLEIDECTLATEEEIEHLADDV